ncbi:unnamed protein product [Protopolystoma xenopodis]|uniref:Uncharacterized protein n=1 Tax=Protopolystoma xenopodis TaxID=117903 RepID=A0A3S5C240_9PLAT|nr:unnamed protein product [Protopolystoma xenopodis]
MRLPCPSLIQMSDFGGASQLSGPTGSSLVSLCVQRVLLSARLFSSATSSSCQPLTSCCVTSCSTEILYSWLLGNSSQHTDRLLYRDKCKDLTRLPYTHFHSLYKADWGFLQYLLILSTSVSPIIRDRTARRFILISLLWMFQRFLMYQCPVV